MLVLATAIGLAGALFVGGRPTSAAVGSQLGACPVPVPYTGTSGSVARTADALVYANPDASAVVHRMSSGGACGAILPDLPAVAGITALAYDGVRNAVWAIANGDVYTIDLAGAGATPQFSLPAGTYGGLAYDAQLDALWISLDSGYAIHRYDLSGVEQASCATSFGVRGLAVGADSIFGSTGSMRIYQLNKSSCTGGGGPSVITDWTTSEWDGGLTCDPLTFAPAEAIWSRGVTSNTLTAYEVPAGTCPLGGGVAPVPTPAPTDTPAPAPTDTPVPSATDTPAASPTDTPVSTNVPQTNSPAPSGGNAPAGTPTVAETSQPQAPNAPTDLPLPAQSPIEPPSLDAPSGDQAGAGAGPGSLPDAGSGPAPDDVLLPLIALALWLAGLTVVCTSARTRRS